MAAFQLNEDAGRDVRTETFILRKPKRGRGFWGFEGETVKKGRRWAVRSALQKGCKGTGEAEQVRRVGGRQAVVLLAASPVLNPCLSDSSPLWSTRLVFGPAKHFRRAQIALPE